MAMLGLRGRTGAGDRADQEERWPVATSGKLFGEVLSRMIPVPTLAEVVADGAKLADLPFTALWSLLREVGKLEKEIITAMLPAAGREAAQIAPQDRALTIGEAAERLRISPAAMTKWLRKPPYNAAVVVRSRTCVRVSAQRLEQILLDRGAGPRRKAAAG